MTHCPSIPAWAGHIRRFPAKSQEMWGLGVICGFGGGIVGGGQLLLVLVGVAMKESPGFKPRGDECHGIGGDPAGSLRQAFCSRLREVEERRSSKERCCEDGNPR